MTSRRQQKNTESDELLYDCVNALPPRSFLITAGAGSGKTTSLIKCLDEILRKYGARLRLKRQKVACITYTDIAAGEIWAEVGNSPLAHVSTIHSFFWSLVRPFQLDIKTWVENRINSKVRELKESAANFSSRVKPQTREKNRRDSIRYEQLQGRINGVSAFTYSVGSDYGNGVLGHDDIIKMVPEFIMERPLLRRLVAQQFPFLFVDESQDTMPHVVEALKAINKELSKQFCLGFFGDPMQQIYPTGIGTIPQEPDWTMITKTENFRCPRAVLSVANAIRRDGDGLVQTRGRMIEQGEHLINFEGSAQVFVLPIDEKREQRIGQVRSWSAKRSNDASWEPVDGIEGVKVLVVVHRMAATRLGFGDLYSALNDHAPEKFKTGFMEGTAWPVRPFTSFVLPLVTASKAGDEFLAMQILRAQSPILRRDSLLKAEVATRLKVLGQFTKVVEKLMSRTSGKSVAEVLRYIHESGAFDLEPRLLAHLKQSISSTLEVPESDVVESDEAELDKETAAMKAFLACPAAQFWGYFDYVNEKSPFSTQQGIKGAEFERVMVVLDDDEGTHTQFSYDKYLGLKDFSDRDLANIREGKETVVDRTRRLFYVCCTRALQDLVVVLFTADVETARTRIIELGLFPAEAVHLADELG